MERRPFDEFHDQIVRPDIVNLAHAGMIQGGYGLGFALKALGELLRGDFDGHVAIQARIPRSIHFAHTTRANQREDLIRAELCTGRERHVRGSDQFNPSWIGSVLPGLGLRLEGPKHRNKDKTKTLL